MKVRALLEHLKDESPELNVELTKVIAVPRDTGPDPAMITLDFPIIGTARKHDDLYLVIESAKEMIAFGKDIRFLDGRPAVFPEALLNDEPDIKGDDPEFVDSAKKLRAELKLLRDLRKVVNEQGAVTPEIHSILGKLSEL